jgi:hypothetical protein
VVLGMD